ncbi:MAG: glycosyltransferase family 87 protein [Acidimicrobiales bacterium]|nr:glycosyltransferase family 87 protein [Acidimicrobiales bacterium]
MGATVLLGAEHARSWHFFAEAADLLRGGGLDLYRAHPEFQFGPLSVVIATLFRALPGPIEVWAVMVTGSLAGVGALALAVDAVRRRHPELETKNLTRLVVIVGLPFLLVWLRLSAYSTHIDDVNALVALVAAGSLLDRRRSGWATACLVVAAGAKPWAVIFAPLAALGPGRLRAVRPFVVAAVSGATWLPFLLGAPGTLDALRGFTIGVDPNSGLVALGFLDASTPSWLRAAQLVLGLVVTGLVVWRRGSWPAALAAGICARLSIDPATHHYYTAAFALTALVWELDHHPGRMPWRTTLGVIVLEVAAADVTLSGFMPYMRISLLVSVIAMTLTSSEDETARHDLCTQVTVRPRPAFSVSSGTVP